MLTNMTQQSTNQIYAFFHGSRPVGQIRQINYIDLLEKNFRKKNQLIVLSITVLGILETKNLHLTWKVSK